MHAPYTVEPDVKELPEAIPAPTPLEGSAPVAAPASADDFVPWPEKPTQPASYLFFAVVAAVAAALDLASKEWAHNTLAGPAPIKGGLREMVVIPGYFSFQYAQNPGGAWSMLRSLPEIWRRPFFLIVSTAASVFITSLYQRVDRRDWPMKWGLPLSLGGAVGNLVDRVRRGYVVDFLSASATWGGRERHWPTFNVADIWIVVGVVLMGITMFRVRRTH